MEEYEDAIAWARALLNKSDTKTEVNICVRVVVSREICSILEAFLESAPKLNRAFFGGGYNDTEMGRRHTAKIIDRLLSAAQRNPSIQFIRINNTEFCASTIINLLHRKRSSIKTLFLFDSGHSMRSHLSFRAIANSMKECDSLEHVGLENLSETFYISILKYGLSNHPSLQQLQLGELRSTDENIVLAIQHMLISSGPDLKSLTFYNCHFSHLMMELIVNGLKQHPTIKSLTMEDCQFGDPGTVQALARLLKSTNNKIHSLDLNSTKLDTVTLHEILSALHQNPSLRYLNMWDCGLDDDNSISHVQNLLHHNKAITHLNLSANDFGASGAALLANEIHNLIELECDGCSLGDAGIQALLPLSTVGESHLKLKKISLDGNDFTGQGILHLVDFLMHPSCQISCLSLCANPIDGSGCGVLQHMLQTSQRLVELSLDLCHLSLGGVYAILSSLQRNQTLEVLRLRKVTDDYHASDGNGSDSDSDIDSAIEHNYRRKAVYKILARSIRVCRLKKLTLDLDFDGDKYVDKSSDLEFEGEEINCGQETLLGAFADNTTLEEVKVSKKFFHSQRQQQLAHYILRNKFQPFMHIDHKEFTSNNSASGINDRHMSLEVGNDLHFSDVPRGLWAHILEAAHKRHHNASVLHYLLSSRLDLILAREQ